MINLHVESFSNYPAHYKIPEASGIYTQEHVATHAACRVQRIRGLYGPSHVSVCLIAGASGDKVPHSALFGVC